MGLYDLACAAGPTLGPIVAGFAVVANGWRWAFWEMLWITGFALALLSFSMPEVSLLPPPSSSFFLLSSFYSIVIVIMAWSTGEVITDRSYTL
jgi:MFS family permease